MCVLVRALEWRHYVTDNGDFELGSYLYRVISDLMKQSLDMGTLLSNDPAKLRAFKEQTKSTFKKRWLEVAQALENFEILTSCGCPISQYCAACGGSRYRLNTALSPDRLREIAVVLSTDINDPQLALRLAEGLEKALLETQEVQNALP